MECFPEYLIWKHAWSYCNKTDMSFEGEEQPLLQDIPCYGVLTVPPSTLTHPQATMLPEDMIPHVTCHLSNLCFLRWPSFLWWCSNVKLPIILLKVLYLVPSFNASGTLHYWSCLAFCYLASCLRLW
jgi:hypothetical protein